MQPLIIKYNLSKVHCYKHDDSGSKAEPFIWVVFFKIDGDTTFINHDNVLQGKATVIGSSGNHGNLAEVMQGRSVTIPNRIGTFQTQLNPINMKNFPGMQRGGHIGCLVILNEEDQIPSDNAIAIGYRKLIKEVQKELNQVIPTLRLGNETITEEQKKQIIKRVQKAVLSKIKKSVSFVEKMFALHTFTTNKDDKIGHELFDYSHAYLEKKNRKTH